MALLAIAIASLNGCDGTDTMPPLASVPELTGRADAMLASHMSAPVAVGSFTGTFHATLDGSQSVLNLTERDGEVTGTLDAAPIHARSSGGRALGELKDPRTGQRAGNVDLALEGEGLVLRLEVIDSDSSRSVQLAPKTYARGTPPAFDIQRDAQLVGRWRHTWATSGDDAPGLVDVWLQLSGEGSIEQACAAAGDERRAQPEEDGLKGQWCTIDQVLHVRLPSETQWVAFARYRVQGQTLQLTYNDGNRQIYQRQ